MKITSTLQQLATALFLAESTGATAVYREPSLEEARAINAWKRAAPDAPDGYTPAAVDCPSTRPTIRTASGLSDEETSWLEKRRPNTVSSMREFLVRMNITGFDAGAYIDTNAKNTSALPNVAIAVSGGGWRALMNGAGALAAYDNRTPNSTNTGQLGGLLQSATYLAGLSGGGWLVGSLFVNNFTSVQDIIDTTAAESSIWDFTNGILKGPNSGGIQILDTVQYYDDLYDTVNGKHNAHFNTSLTDYWARALSFQLVNASDGGPAYTWSSIANDKDFSAGNTPLPLLVADGRAPGEVLISGNATNYEFNPWEMGSYDPTVYGFAPLKYVGSNFTGGSVASNEKCIEGFDNAAYVMGTSSSLFNQLILNINSTSASTLLKDVITSVLEALGESDNDIADWTPNPFYHFHNDTNPNAASKRLTLVDGGEDLQNIPLNPLIQPIRSVDVIFAVDSSADTTADNGAANWPNGTSLVATYQRSLNNTIENGTAFPSVPDQNTFVNLGLNTHPTFFGCNSSNLTGPAPLVVYIPNTPYVYNSNVSTFTFTYNNTERNAIIENGYDVATMGNGTLDADFPTCMGCAVLSRSMDRTGTTVPDACTKCFTKYCWNGTVDSTTPAKFFPESKFTQVKVSASGKFVPNVVGVVAAVAATVFFML